MQARPAEQLAAGPDARVREWEALRKDDPEVVAEHLAKLRALAVYLNANVVRSTVPQA